MDKLDEIRKIYYATSKSTIERDFDRAIDLLKSMKSEDERERATVFMQGLAEMKAGRPLRAAELLEQARRMNPTSGEVRFDLSLAYEAAGRPEVRAAPPRR